MCVAPSVVVSACILLPRCERAGRGRCSSQHVVGVGEAPTLDAGRDQKTARLLHPYGKQKDKWRRRGRIELLRREPPTDLKSALPTTKDHACKARDENSAYIYIMLSTRDSSIGLRD